MTRGDYAWCAALALGVALLLWWLCAAAPGAGEARVRQATTMPTVYDRPAETEG